MKKILLVVVVFILFCLFTKHVFADINTYEKNSNRIINKYEGLFTKFTDEVTINTTSKTNTVYGKNYTVSRVILGNYNHSDRHINIYYSTTHENRKELESTIVHELGHAIDNRIVNKQIKTKLQNEHKLNLYKINKKYNENFAELFARYVVYDKKYKGYDYTYEIFDKMLRFYNR